MRIVAWYQKNPASKAKFAKRQPLLGSDFTPFMSKSFQIWDPFFILLFSKDSENQKKFGHQTSKSGGKKRLNGVKNETNS